MLSTSFLLSRFRQLSPQQALWWLLAGVTILHLLVIDRFAFGVDEAHYALYGLNLDWSYYDHPPMVGWMQALLLPFSEAEWVMRLWPLLLSLLSSLLLFRLSRELFPKESPWLGVVAVALLQSALIVQLLAMALVPEGPLLLFGLLAVDAFRRVVGAEQPRDWLLLGLWLGLAGLSKYTALLLPIGMLLSIAVERRWSLFRSPWPWLAVGLALLVITPVLWWNHLNDWISIRYQLGHGAPERPWELLRFLRAQAAQLLTYSPALYLIAIGMVVTLLRGWRTEGEGRLLLTLSLPMVLLFGWTGGYEETLPHWTLLIWALWTPLMARWVLHHWPRRWVRVTVWGGVGYSAVLLLLIHSLLFAPWLAFQPNRHPMADLIGWQQAAETARDYHGQQFGDDRESALFIGNWAMASRIAWYGRPLPVQVLDNRYDQFDLWYGAPEIGDRGLLIVPGRLASKPQASGLARFEHCTLLGELPIERGGQPVHQFSFYRCEGFSG